MVYAIWERKWKVNSDTSGSVYIVSKGYDPVTDEERFGCSCLGWTRHTPRRDCKHIKKLKQKIGYN